MLLPQSYQYPNFSEGADRVGGQLRGDTECPFSVVTKSGRVWRKVPESDDRSVGATTMHPRKQCLAASTVSTSSLSTAVEEMKVRPRMPSSSEGGGASTHYRGVGVPVLGAHTHYRGWGCLYSLQVVMGAHTHYRGWVYPYSLQGVRGAHTHYRG